MGSECGEGDDEKFVDYLRMISEDIEDCKLARDAMSYAWQMDLSDVPVDEFPCRETRITLEEMTRTKKNVVDSASLVNIWPDDVEEYIHPDGVFIRFLNREFLTNSQLEDIRDGNYVKSESDDERFWLYEVIFFAREPDKIQNLAGRWGLKYCPEKIGTAS